LLDEFTVLQNVMLPGLKLGKFSEQEVESRAMEKLKMLGIDILAQKQASQISGGEKQRVAIARALINDPHIIMGDEPTGNLDHKNSEIVFDVFKKLAEEFKQTLLIVTHDQSFADRTHRIINMEDGRIIS
jgi:lipoprotein-releasing system ATP-binding protein